MWTESNLRETRGSQGWIQAADDLRESLIVFRSFPAFKDWAAADWWLPVVGSYYWQLLEPG